MRKGEMMTINLYERSPRVAMGCIVSGRFLSKAKRDLFGYTGSDNDTSIQLITGNFVDLVSPCVDDINIFDIAWATAMMPRYTGHAGAGYTIAEHMEWGSDRCSPEAAPYFLLHDAHEGYLGDDSSPKKRALRKALVHVLGVTEDQAKKALNLMAHQFDAVIYRRFELEWPMPLHIAEEVKHWDLVALATEKRDLMLHDRPWSPMPPPYLDKIVANNDHELSLYGYLGRAVELGLVKL